LNAAKFDIKLKKCKFFEESINVLGHTILSNGIIYNNSDSEFIKKLSKPFTQKDMQKFLGYANFYRKFIVNFSQIAAPLHKLGVKSNWNGNYSVEEQNAYDQLLNEMSKQHLLYRPNWDYNSLLKLMHQDTQLVVY
jgi:hypothetical protein